MIPSTVLTPTAPPSTAKVVEISTKIIEFVCSEETIDIEAMRKAFFSQVRISLLQGFLDILFIMLFLYLLCLQFLLSIMFIFTVSFKCQMIPAHINVLSINDTKILM